MPVPRIPGVRGWFRRRAGPARSIPRRPVVIWAVLGRVQTDAHSGPLRKLGKPEGLLDSPAWPGYLESGLSDPRYDWVTDFEARTGCRLDVRVAGTSDERVAPMQEKRFDLVTASGDASPRHPACACLRMEHSLDPRVQGGLASWVGSVPVVPAACRGNPLLTDDGCRLNGREEFDRIAFWRTPAAQCADPKGCVPVHRWVSDYAAVPGGR